MQLTAKNVAIICPTKNQPEKVLRLLSSVAELDISPHQVIIADGGHDLKRRLVPHTTVLNLTCLYSPEPGQILQRNHALGFLDDEIRLVLYLDDDMTLDRNSLTKILAFWNFESGKKERLLAGVSLNVVDLPKLRPSLIRKLFFLQLEPAGGVSKSGYCIPYAPTQKSIETSWLLGGATLWSRDILEKYRHPINFPTRWAVCEDLMYSFPLSRNYRLMVAADAHAYHNETYSELSFKQGVFYGLSGAIMRYHFIKQNDGFKTWAYLWMTIGIIVGNLVRGVLGSPRHLGLCLGGVRGLILTLKCSLLKQDSVTLAKSLFDR